MSTPDGTPAPASPGSFEEIRQILREAAIRAERTEARAERIEARAEAWARENRARAEAWARENRARAEASERENKAWAEKTEAWAREYESRAREYEARSKELSEQAAKELAEHVAAAEKRGREMDRRLEETRELFRKQREEAEWRFRHEAGRFDDRWGRFLESLVAGDLVPLLRARGIDVNTTSTRYKKQRDGKHIEFDILAVNGEEAVVVEVKTKLRPEAVKRFTEKLRVFRDWFPDHRDRTLYGAMAYLEGDDDVALHAERQGLFVIRATGSSASIVNAPDFEPREFP